MSDKYIPIKKLSDVHNNEFYPLTAAKGTITTEDIIVKNVLGGNRYKTKVPAGENLFDILTEIFGAKLDILSDFIDVETLTNEKTRVPSSYLLTKILLSLLGGNLNLKFKVCTYIEYKAWLDAGTIDPNTLYFTTGGVPKEYWTITFNANGGTVSPSIISVEKGSSYGTLPIPVYSGHVFQGWFTSASGGTKINSSDIPTTNTTLYAHWREATEDDILCFEEDFTKLVITEDEKYNISLTDNDNIPILSVETTYDPMITEDRINNICVNGEAKDDFLIVTEVDRKIVDSKNHEYSMSWKKSTEPVLATEIVKDLVDSEDKLYNFKVGTTATSSNTQALKVTTSSTKVLQEKKIKNKKLNTSSQLAQAITEKKKRTRKRKK